MLPLNITGGFGILFAEVGQILTKYSLIKFCDNSVFIRNYMLLSLTKSVIGVKSFLFNICLIVCHVCLLLNLYSQIFLCSRRFLQHG